MDDSPIPNDFSAALPLFVGRDEAFSRIRHHLNSPIDVPPVVFLGRQHIGKTALLRQFQASDVIAVYVSLEHTAIENEPAWIHTLSQLIAETISAHGFSSSPVEPFPDDTGTLREWFAEIYLPSLFRLIRRQRQLAILLDDAEHLLHAIIDGNLPSDTFRYLNSLLNPQLGMALTIDVQYESDLGKMSPLVKSSAIHRLGDLPLKAVQEYFQSLVQPAYTDEAVQSIYKLSGGEPLLLQRMVQFVSKEGKETITADDVKSAGAATYHQMSAYFREIWDSLSRDERLVLTAVSALIYANPLQQIDTAQIESWLVETDYPLDTTAINAVIRSLDYREVLEGAATDVRVKSGLMQKWLLENALIEDPPTRHAGSPPTWMAVGIVLILIVIAVLLALSLGDSTSSTATTPEPTITLLPGS